VCRAMRTAFIGCNPRRNGGLKYSPEESLPKFGCMRKFGLILFVIAGLPLRKNGFLVKGGNGEGHEYGECQRAIIRVRKSEPLETRVEGSKLGGIDETDFVDHLMK